MCSVDLQFLKKQIIFPGEEHAVCEIIISVLLLELYFSLSPLSHVECQYPRPPPPPREIFAQREVLSNQK